MSQSATDQAQVTSEAPRASSNQQFLTFARAMLKGYFRDRTALFFTFFFPLMFLVVFGLIFRDDATSTTPIGVVGSGPVIDNLPTEVFEITAYDSMGDAVAAIGDGDLSAAVQQDGSTVEVRYAASDQVQAATVNGILSSVVDRANVAASGRAPQFSLEATRVEDEDLRPIQFLTPGILSWGVATSAAFGAALTLVSWRRKKLLRRIQLSPAPTWTVVAARVGVSMVVAIVQAVLFIVVALTPPFGLRLDGTWYLAVPLLLAGTLSFLAIGLFVGAISQTEEAATAIANFLIIPMAFLSGSFFDISAGPDWLQAISKALPLRWMNDGMLAVLARGQGVEAIWLPCLVLLGFAAVVTAIATRFFSWDDA